MKTSRPLLPLVALCAALFACGGGGGSGGGGGGGGETWTGTLTGTALGAFVCLSGTDGWYDEAATVTLTVPGTGLAAMLQDTTVYDFGGSYSDVETAHENSGGVGCAPQPSVTSSNVGPTQLAVEKVMAQLQLSSTSVLMPAHFRYSTTSDVLDARKLFLDAQTIAADKVTGAWHALADPSSRAVIASGTFVLTRTSATGGGQPPPTPAGFSATGGAGQVALSWQASTGATSYHVYGAPGSTVTPGASTLLGSATGTTYTASGLANGTTYAFVVTALSGSAESAPSAVVTATPGAAAGGEIFLVGNGATLSVFAESASGSPAPLRTVVGSSTLLANPTGVSVDAANAEVAIADYPNVLVFARSASGNVAPLRSFTGNGQKVRVDPVHGEIGVLDGASVRFYARTATGAPSPLRTLQVAPGGGSSAAAYDFVIDLVNDELLVVSGTSTPAPVQVTVYARTATGTTAALRTFTAFASLATGYADVAVDPGRGEIYVTANAPYGNPGTAVFARLATGTPAPLRQVTAAGNALYLDAAAGELGLVQGQPGSAATLDVLSVTSLASARSLTQATYWRGVDVAH